MERPYFLLRRGPHVIDVYQAPFTHDWENIYHVITLETDGQCR